MGKKDKPATGETPTAPDYEIVGLAPADHMPIQFDGQTYDLARLSADQAAYLLGFPDQVPYLKPLEASPPAPTN